MVKLIPYLLLMSLAVSSTSNAAKHRGITVPRGWNGGPFSIILQNLSSLTKEEIVCIDKEFPGYDVPEWTLLIKEQDLTDHCGIEDANKLKEILNNFKEYAKGFES